MTLRVRQPLADPRPAKRQTKLTLGPVNVRDFMPAPSEPLSAIEADGVVYLMPSPALRTARHRHARVTRHVGRMRRACVACACVAASSLTTAIVVWAVLA